MKNKLTPCSQMLRKNMTKEEKHLWYDFLRNLQITVERQKVIGNYIADFYIASAKIIIESDGSQHFTEEGEKQDKQRDRFFQKIGIKVLRYSNRQIHKNFNEVSSDIFFELEKRR